MVFRIIRLLHGLNYFSPKTILATFKYFFYIQKK